MAGEQDHRRRARRVRRRAAAHRSSAAQDGQCRAHAASRLRGAAELPRLFRRRGRRHPRVSRRQAGAGAGVISKDVIVPRAGTTTSARDTADNGPAHRAMAEGGGTSGEIITGAPPPAGGGTSAAGGTGAAAGGAAGGVAATGAGGLPGSTTTRVPTFTRV